jgi:rRNA maturation endonuclease Nob1
VVVVVVVVLVAVQLRAVASAGGANMNKVKRWICSACKGNYFPDHALALGRCPGCGGHGEVKTVEQDDAGVVHVPAD